ncbi:hypothetical protein H0O00_03940 [Candidatus Micrarchaeota archaeon]|nr:hypothetical protein [Candidatus Micrarchaeota archaeon]
MTGPKLLRRNDADGSALAMAKGFGRYKPEEEKSVREALVSQDPMLEKLKRIYKGLKCNPDRDRPSPVEAFEPENEFWSLLTAFGRRLNCSDKDVEAFSLALADFQHEKDFPMKAGLFLSALINGGKSKTYTLRTNHLEVPPDYIGYKNRKTIVVEGNAGDNVGSTMKEGLITVKGNAGYGVGDWMEGGRIIVEGDVDYNLGVGTKDGTITVKGDATLEVGAFMRGGRIDIEGRFAGISNTLDDPDIMGEETESTAEIYCKGRRVWPSK